MNFLKLNLTVIIISDRAAQGVRDDETIPLVQTWCDENSMALVETHIVSDEPEDIRNIILSVAKNTDCDLIISSGGTGLAERDHTPEVTNELIDKPIAGITEYLRSEGVKKNKYAILSRGVAGIIGEKLIINLPGNPKAVVDSLDWVKKILPHAIKVLQDPVRDQDHSSV